MLTILIILRCTVKTNGVSVFTLNTAIRALIIFYFYVGHSMIQTIWCFLSICQIRPDRQTLYWSATWPKEVETLARRFVHDPYKVSDLFFHKFAEPFLKIVFNIFVNV